jgi:hypothetical protein
MTYRWRSSKENDKLFFERIVKGMRNEKSTVLWKTEKVGTLLLSLLDGCLQNGRESMVGAVEEVMNCVTDGIAKEWGTRDQEEKESEENGRQEGKEP